MAINVGTDHGLREFLNKMGIDIRTSTEGAKTVDLSGATVTLPAGVDVASQTIDTLTTDTISEGTAGSGVKVDTAVIRDGNFHGVQGAPTAETGAATITIADMLTGIITLTHSTGADVALTVDTGTAMDTGMPASFGVGSYIDWSVINLSAALLDTGTVTAAAGHTLVGSGLVESAHADSEFPNSARFRSRRTATNTWITYRIA